MNIQLYTEEFGATSQRPLIALYEANVHFDETKLSSRLDLLPKWFYSVSPQGILPVIKIGEEIVVGADSIGAILEKNFPKIAKLYQVNKKKKASFETLLIRCKTQFEPLIEEYLKDTESEKKDELAQKLIKELEFMEQSIRGPYFMGTTLTWIDINYWTFMERIPLLEEFHGFKMPEYKNIIAWREKLLQRESFSKAKYPQLTLKVWYEAKPERRLVTSKPLAIGPLKMIGYFHKACKNTVAELIQQCAETNKDQNEKWRQLHQKWLILANVIKFHSKCEKQVTFPSIKKKGNDIIDSEAQNQAYIDNTKAVSKAFGFLMAIIEIQCKIRLKVTELRSNGKQGVNGGSRGKMARTKSDAQIPLDKVPNNSPKKPELAPLPKPIAPVSKGIMKQARPMSVGAPLLALSDEVSQKKWKRKLEGDLFSLEWELHKLQKQSNKEKSITALQEELQQLQTKLQEYYNVVDPVVNEIEPQIPALQKRKIMRRMFGVVEPRELRQTVPWVLLRCEPSEQDKLLRNLKEAMPYRMCDIWAWVKRIMKAPDWDELLDRNAPLMTHVPEAAPANHCLQIIYSTHKVIKVAIDNLEELLRSGNLYNWKPFLVATEVLQYIVILDFQKEIVVYPWLLRVFARQKDMASSGALAIMLQSYSFDHQSNLNKVKKIQQTIRTLQDNYNVIDLQMDKVCELVGSILEFITLAKHLMLKESKQVIPLLKQYVVNKALEAQIMREVFDLSPFEFIEKMVPWTLRLMPDEEVRDFISCFQESLPKRHFDAVCTAIRRVIPVQMWENIRALTEAEEEGESDDEESNKEEITDDESNKEEESDSKNEEDAKT